MASPPRDPRKPLTDALASLDDVGELAPLDEKATSDALTSSLGGLASLDDLQSLDGSDAPSAAQGEIPTLSPLASLDGAEAPLEAPPVLEVAVAVAAPAPVALAPAPRVSEAARFAPPESQQVGLEIEVARPLVSAPPVEETQPTAEAEAEAEPQLCPEHEQPEPCQACAERERPIPGRLFQGALRRQPLVRLAAGLALGLLVGYLASLPYSGRAERRVAIVKAEADKVRYFNAPEMQEETRRLDAQAEEMANSAVAGTVAIWLVVAGGVIAGWYRAT